MSWSWAYLKTLLGFKKSYDAHDLIAVVWPVAYPSGYPAPEEPHCTIVMLGAVEEANFTKEEVLDIIQDTLKWNSFPFAKVKGVEWFGENVDIPVLRLEHFILHDYQADLKMRLENAGIRVDNRFPEYKPHVTITPDAAITRNYPGSLMLCPVQLWWGGEKIRVGP